MGDIEQHVDRRVRYWLIREENLKRLSASAADSEQMEISKVRCQVFREKSEPSPFGRRRNG